MRAIPGEAWTVNPRVLGGAKDYLDNVGPDPIILIFYLYIAWTILPKAATHLKKDPLLLFQVYHIHLQSQTYRVTHAN